METDASAASWHPALMPNSSSDAAQHQSPPSKITNEDESDHSHHADGNGDEKHDNEEDTQDDRIGQSGSNAGAFLDQFGDDDDDDDDDGVGAWDLSPDPTQSATETSQPAVTTTVTHSAPMNTSKHASKNSFARTVSHEPDFIDDDEPEFNMQRSDTDLFKFMPPNDRTNSFPVVPARDNPPDQTANRPRATSQAQEIVQELEDEDHDDSTAHAGAPTSSGFDDTSATRQENESSFRPALGGDVSGTDAAGTRYEEGLPLIAQGDNESENEAEDEGENEDREEKPDSQQRKLGDFAGAFGDEEDGEDGDDFFKQVKGQSEEVISPPALQRKSTTMAISDVTGPDDEDDELAGPNEGGHAKALAESKGDEERKTEETTQAEPGDLDAKWAAAFDDDDTEFLAEPTSTEKKELDPAEIFGSDDEGFLDDDDDDTAAGAPTTPQVEAPGNTIGANGRYTPAMGAPSQRAPNPYAPAAGGVTQASAPAQTQQPSAYSHLAQGPASPAVSMFTPAPPKPELPKAQSFADKAKGGYQSPYDLPMDVVKQPKKRASTQSMMSRPSTSGSMGPPTTGSMGPPPPVRSAGAQSQPPPMPLGRRGSSQSIHEQHSGGAAKPSSLKHSSSGFFEDLPMSSSRSRPASRSSYRPPSQLGPQGPLPGSPLASPMGPPSPNTVPQQGPPQKQQAGTPSLVAPERVSPYAALQSGSEPKPAVPAAAGSRYSPAPPSGLAVSNGGAVPPAAMSRYSPAPPLSRASSGGYAAIASGIPPPIHTAHQPRTSSPLAHFEISRDGARNRQSSPAQSDAGGVSLARSNSNQYEPKANRIPSLPTTQEVEEEVSAALQGPPQGPPMPSNMSPQLKYSNVEARRTPPPSGLQPSMLSPPKRSTGSYTPQSAPSPVIKDSNFFALPPPSRSHAGSPALGQPSQAPASVHGLSPTLGGQTSPVARPTVRARGMSQSLNLVPPTDGREHDPLQRWKGSPVFSWGVGGTFVTSFPKDIPRYGIQSAVPQIVRSPGEVKVKHVKDIHSLDERVIKFPGPLKGKSKKKEVISWLATAIQTLDQQLPPTNFQHHVYHEDKRAEERVLLYKILKVFIENDGVLEGNPNVDKAVREVISPEASASDSSDLSSGAALGILPNPITTMQADSVDSSAIEQIRKFLLAGEREKAAWLAVDRRLWGHALLLANTVQTADLYKKVAQEFIKKEVNHPGLNNEPLAALYSVLSGNYEESVDELVPVHARAGLQLMSTSAAGTESKDALAGLDKWRETLGLILSNRSLADVQALGSLGNLLSSYGRAEAAHICFLFARQHVVFGGLDDPNAQFVLVGADHRRQADHFAKETEALLLSEVFEYGLSLAGGVSSSLGCPHLAAYKLQHALVLSQYGFRDKALQYCDSIYNALSSQTKRSPYYHPGLESAVDDLMKRIKQAPKEESSSWITKPTMNQVSSGMWNRFNKFVAGDDSETPGDGTVGENGVESGPFARIAGETPTISRSPSVNNFETFGSNPMAASVPNLGIAATKAGSRYAPGSSHSATSPYEPSNSFVAATRTSGELLRSPYDASNSGAFANGNQYIPQTPNSVFQAPLTYGNQTSPYAPTQPSDSEAPGASPYAAYGGYEPYAAPTAAADGKPETQQHAEPAANNANSGYQAPSYGYQPSSMNSYSPPTLNTFDSTESGGAAAGGFEPPSYQPSTFEAPSYEPDPETQGDAEAEGEKKPKKKSFMDDDDDDFPSMKPKEKTKAEKDRENEELIRRVAEQEAKQAAEAKAAKKGGWGFGGWFGGAKKESAEQPKAIKAKLGEQSSFVYDPELKRWVNKKAGAEDTVARTATPPPPRATPPPPSAAPTPSASAPPMGPPRTASPAGHLTPPNMEPTRPATLQSSVSEGSAGAAGGPSLMPPPARPSSRLSNASSIDDLLGAAGPRKGGKKPRKSGRYVDVMAK